jgi:hypothetical protein
VNRQPLNGFRFVVDISHNAQAVTGHCLPYFLSWQLPCTATPVRVHYRRNHYQRLLRLPLSSYHSKLWCCRAWFRKPRMILQIRDQGQVKHVTLARSILRFYTEYLCWPDISLHDRQWTVILPLDLSSALEPPRSMSSLTRYSTPLPFR